MRLINIWTLELQEFFDKSVPPYFILSHRWGEQEISYKDYSKKKHLEGPGYDKIVGACKFARLFALNDQTSSVLPSLKLEVSKYKDGADCMNAGDLGELYASVLINQPSWTIGHFKDSLLSAAINWIWIDTCCIDKRSTAELSEAINSMYLWYQRATICFTYLADVTTHTPETDQREALKNSSWFLRGWTLQELLAPERIIFCNDGWEAIGHICPDDIHYRILSILDIGPDLAQEVSEITGIPREIVQTLHLSSPSVPQIMSWASHRVTTRSEDEAYCLLGLLRVNMPLIYGEGRKAFRRLQEEIIKTSRDQSIFAWCEQSAPGSSGVGYHFGMLADSPSRFSNCGNIFFDPTLAIVDRPYAITHSGIQLEIGLSDANAYTMAITSDIQRKDR